MLELLIYLCKNNGNNENSPTIEIITLILMYNYHSTNGQVCPLAVVLPEIRSGKNGDMSPHIPPICQACLGLNGDDTE